MISQKKLISFQNNINFEYKNVNNLLKALIHPSYIKEKKSSNQRKQK